MLNTEPIRYSLISNDGQTDRFQADRIYNAIKSSEINKNKQIVIDSGDLPEYIKTELTENTSLIHSNLPLVSLRIKTFLEFLREQENRFFSRKREEAHLQYLADCENTFCKHFRPYGLENIKTKEEKKLEK